MTALLIPFEECLRDSPYFRDAAELNQNQLDELEGKLEKMLKTCNAMINSGKELIQNQSHLVSNVYDLSQYFKGDERMTTSLNKVAHTQQEIMKFKSILLDQASRSLSRVISNFIQKDIKRVKDAKVLLDKVTADCDNALNKYANLPKSGFSVNRLSEKVSPEETQNLVMATRACFRHTALDYVCALSIVKSKFKHEILDAILCFMHANSTYFHQGSDLFQDVDPFLKKLGNEISSMREETNDLEKMLDNRHTIVHNKDMVATSTSKIQRPSILLEGYLFKRTSSKFKTWNRRWFIIWKNQLAYRKRNGGMEISVMEEDLKLCSVKPSTEIDRRFCFEINSPSKSHTLQADSEESFNAWLLALQQAIGIALQQSFNNHENNREDQTPEARSLHKSLSSSSLSSSSSKTGNYGFYETIRKIPGNDRCCDCGSTDAKWASINLGIVVCVDCSGIHRSLGVHFSKVRSLTLDSWEPEIVKVMKELGNEVVNKIYLAHIPDNAVQATLGCSNAVREEWIQSKYVKRKFVRDALLLSKPPEEDDSSRGRIIRHWSVRKIRRRSKSGSRKTDDRSDKSAKLSTESAASVDKENKCFDTSKDGELENPVNTVEIVTIGEDLGDKSFLILSEDDNEDSTDGEDNISIGAESLSKLSPEMILYKASRAHNIPVMALAIALGADKNWINEEDKQRTPLHQAVISVSVFL
ncbi:hypothetical protein QYM36_012268 [Artemia franciscana]|uniref:Arf-GAP with coiled-coil, ANK repeat and PH domain-containing protein 2 n=1 Tax=Artemia franciscana TaxID=6661 RepID=A0AA88HPT5_ARTSF|nr:hypothetical protein QYM36_012268 [Artemia franciscana]